MNLVERSREISSLVSPGERDLALAMLADYGWLIDEGRLDEWLELFSEQCVYKVVPRENIALGLSGFLILCESKDMLRDRIMSLRQANKYNIHTPRHVIGLPRFRRIDARSFAAEMSYAVFQSNQDGESRLFSVGTYTDRIEIENGVARLREKIVIVDTFSVPSLLAVPL
jgi:anthranilate 1,2-dioxygenase small subunit